MAEVPRVILADTSDKRSTFHPFVLAVLKGETAEDYAFVFEVCTSPVEYGWKPTILLPDGSDGITSGYTMISGVPDVRCMCYFLVIENWEKHLKTLKKI